MVVSSTTGVRRSSSSVQVHDARATFRARHLRIYRRADRSSVLVVGCVTSLSADRDSRAVRLARLDLRGGPKRRPVGGHCDHDRCERLDPPPGLPSTTAPCYLARNGMQSAVSLRYAGAKSRSVSVVRRLRVDSRAAGGVAAPRREAVVMTGRTSPESWSGESGPAFPHVHAEDQNLDVVGGPGRSRRRCGPRMRGGPRCRARRA